MGVPRLTSKQWIALILGAFFALFLFSQAVAPKATTWSLTKGPFELTSPEVVANPSSDISLDLSQVLVGLPTPHFRGQFVPGWYVTLSRRTKLLYF